MYVLRKNNFCNLKIKNKIKFLLRVKFSRCKTILNFSKTKLIDRSFTGFVQNVISQFLNVNKFFFLNIQVDFTSYDVK